ncbi:hypothetical protein OIU78_029993 [Salix suchowensis]|nr:hypothetical protein OIU78_029993 [Salix suchowensis]
MSPVRKYSYHRLGHEGWSDEEAEEERAFRRIRDFSRVNRFSIRKRLKLRIPGLRRFSRKRARLFSRVKISWLRAWKRLKNGQAHINDLFGGNFLVMQVSPAPFKCVAQLIKIVSFPIKNLSTLSHFPLCPIQTFISLQNWSYNIPRTKACPCFQ